MLLLCAASFFENDLSETNELIEVAFVSCLPIRMSISLTFKQDIFGRDTMGSEIPALLSVPHFDLQLSDG